MSALELDTVEAPMTLPGEISETGLILPEGLSFDDWEAVGQKLQRVEKSVRWWIGDWLAYGERVYGETYAQAVEATGRKVEDLMNMAYVAGKIETSLRNENLSWSHHKEVAPLAPQVQSAWLSEAEANNWSVVELRDQIKGKKNAVAPTVPVCKKCKKECNWCRIEISCEKDANV